MHCIRGKTRFNLNIDGLLFKLAKYSNNNFSSIHYNNTIYTRFQAELYLLFYANE